MNVWEGVGAFKEARTFCELWGIAGTVLVDERAELVERLGVRGVPTNILVDEDGTITCVGATTPRELEAAVSELLGPDADFEPAAGAGEWHWHTEAEEIEARLTQRVDSPPDAQG